MQTSKDVSRLGDYQKAASKTTVPLKAAVVGSLGTLNAVSYAATYYGLAEVAATLISGLTGTAIGVLIASGSVYAGGTILKKIADRHTDKIERILNDSDGTRKK